MRDLRHPGSTGLTGHAFGREAMGQPAKPQVRGGGGATRPKRSGRLTQPPAGSTRQPRFGGAPSCGSGRCVGSS